MNETKAEQLERLRLSLAVARAQKDNRLLKQARAAKSHTGVHDEVDVLHASQKAEGLRAKLAQLREGEKREAGQLCYGLPPEWRSGSSSSSSHSNAPGEWSGCWQAGTEVCYTTSLGGERLEVTHSQRPVRLQVYARPFAHGGLRQTFYAKDEHGGRFVLKRELHESSRLKRRLAVLHADAEVAALSQAAAEAFCAAVRQPGTVKYLTASIVVLDAAADCPGKKAVFLKEPWLDTNGTRWVKFTRNDGHIFPEGVEPAAAPVQAFTHFSLSFLRRHMGCEGMVLDAQASRGAEGGAGFEGWH
ncbi:hypothetical protein ABPG75_009321 [Micractinium tetrahymenae]